MNEQIRQLSHRYARGEEVEFVCECSAPGCFDLVALPPHLYESIRACGNRFFAKRDHAEDEQHIAATGDIVIVEKTGADGRQAIRADRRRALAGAAAA